MTIFWIFIALLWVVHLSRLCLGVKQSRFVIGAAYLVVILDILARHILR